MSKTIEITVNPQGEATIEAIGYNGKGCKAATKPIEEAIGVVKNVSMKQEFHQNVANKNQSSLRRY